MHNYVDIASMVSPAPYWPEFKAIWLVLVLILGRETSTGQLAIRWRLFIPFPDILILYLLSTLSANMAKSSSYTDMTTAYPRLLQPVQAVHPHYVQDPDSNGNILPSRPTWRYNYAANIKSLYMFQSFQVVAGGSRPGGVIIGKQRNTSHIWCISRASEFGEYYPEWKGTVLNAPPPPLTEIWPGSCMRSAASESW